MASALADDREFAAARIHELEQTHPGWDVWFGTWTGQYMALHSDVPRLVVARTSGEMARLMTGWDQWRRQRA